MLDPDEVASRVPRWLRVLLVGVLLAAASGAGLFAYRYFTHPTTLTVAAGSIDGEAVRMMSAIASRPAKTGSSIRLKIVDTGTSLEASRVFAAGKTDLAIVRADLGDLSNARTIILVTQGVAMLIVPPGSSIEDMDGLKGMTVGVVGGEINHRIVDLLTREYDLTRARVRFKDLAPGEVLAAVQAKQVAALLVVAPISEQYLSTIRAFFPAKAKQQPGLIAIGSAGAIANIAKAYESYDLPKGTLRGSPPIPDEDLTTLRVPFYLVAGRKLADDRVTELTGAIMETRSDLLGEFPLLAQIAAPSTDKDAFIPIHRGAAAYLDGTQKDFFEKYGNALFYGPMLLGALASLFAGLWNFMGIGSDQKTASPLNHLYDLAGQVRNAQSEAELASIEEQIDNILKAELARQAKGESEAMHATAVPLAAQRLEHLIDQKRSKL